MQVFMCMGSNGCSVVYDQANEASSVRGVRILVCMQCAAHVGTKCQITFYCFTLHCTTCM